MLRRRRLSAAPPERKRRRIRKLRLLALLAVLLALCASAFTFGLVSAIASEIPNLDPKRQQKLEINAYVYADDGETILAVLRGSENRVLVDSESITPVMKQAIIAIEDRRFLEHRGVDLRGVARALWADIRNQRFVQGGSTITQQFIKNSFDLDERTVARKVREAALAWQLEQKWSKDRILTEYLNTIYFGNGAYGVQQAAKVYFGRGANRLTLPQAALLAGIPADPAGYDPVTRPRRANARRRQVLDAMLDLGMITRADHERASRAPLPAREDVRLPGTQTTKAPYFTNYVKEQLFGTSSLGAQKVFRNGYRVTTTIDLRLQRIARNAIRKWLTVPGGPSAALVALDPRSGNVLAMVGGDNFRKSQFNLAVQGQRQPGSTFKPLVLAAALEEGIAPLTHFVSRPLTISLGDRLWPVSNYEDSYLGSIDIETATVHSDNAVYAQLTQLVGPRAVRRMAERLGIQSPLEDYFSIGLGAQGVNPLELARAFSVFANGGYRIDTARTGNTARAIEQILDHEGNVVSRNRPVPNRVISPGTAATINDLLRKTMERGTARRAYLPDWPAAGKTGTTDNYGDAWFVGYTRDLVAAVWVGYPKELRPMLTEFHGEPVAGGTFPALIWKSFMERALSRLDREPSPFPPPPGRYASPLTVVQRDGAIQVDNGLCREAVQVFYFAGSEPTRTANCRPNEVEVPRVVGLRLADARERLAAQPLRARVLYRPAAPLQPVGVVVDQLPRPPKGRLSSFDRVTLWIAKPTNGVVPKVQGFTLRKARAQLGRRKLQGRVVEFTDGKPWRVLEQRPKWGVAAAPGMTVRLVVGRPAEAAVAAP